VAHTATNSALTSVPEGDLRQMTLTLNRTHTRVDSAYEKLQHAEALVDHGQGQLGLEERWKIGGDEYRKFKDEVMLTKYHSTLDELERLVIMHFSDLGKVGMSGTGMFDLRSFAAFMLITVLGYKLRQQIGKALKRRSEAIHKALVRYNQQAAALTPPHLKISWKDIADYTFLGEFDLLHHSHSSIYDEDWAKPAYCEATVKFFKLCCAHKELTRVEVEVCWLCTAIHNEEREMQQAINGLNGSNPPLASEIQWRYCYRKAVNAIHTHRLNQIKALPGYAGYKGIGTRRRQTTRMDEQTTNEGGPCDEMNGIYLFFALLVAHTI
jgi:hypothetical protein